MDFSKSDLTLKEINCLLKTLGGKMERNVSATEVARRIIFGEWVVIPGNGVFTPSFDPDMVLETCDKWIIDPNLKLWIPGGEKCNVPYQPDLSCNKLLTRLKGSDLEGSEYSNSQLRHLLAGLLTGNVTVEGEVIKGGSVYLLKTNEYVVAMDYRCEKWNVSICDKSSPYFWENGYNVLCDE